MKNSFDITREKIIKCLDEFCEEFTRDPYLCYTEHGIHAYFYQMLFNNLDRPIVEWRDEKLCLIQKEYPTANTFGKTRRQNWDISVINPALDIVDGKDNYKYDYFKLFAVIEFGLNEDLMKDGIHKHLYNDIRRICQREANVKHGFIVHLQRISGTGENRISSRDLSSDSESVINNHEEMHEELRIILDNLNTDNLESLSIHFATSNVSEDPAINSGYWCYNGKDIRKLPVGYII